MKNMNERMTEDELGSFLRQVFARVRESPGKLRVAPELRQAIEDTRDFVAKTGAPVKDRLEYLIKLGMAPARRRVSLGELAAEDLKVIWKLLSRGIGLSISAPTRGDRPLTSAEIATLLKLPSEAVDDLRQGEISASVLNKLIRCRVIKLWYTDTACEYPAAASRGEGSDEIDAGAIHLDDKFALIRTKLANQDGLKGEGSDDAWDNGMEGVPTGSKSRALSDGSARVRGVWKATD